jgi:transketolase
MTYSETEIEMLQEMAKRMRCKAIELAYKAGKNGAHLGGGLSSIEIMAVMYGHVLGLTSENIKNECRNRFVLSKGHGTLAYYTALMETGILSEEMLNTYEINGGLLPGQPVRNLDVGIEASSGSLGMGLSICVGMALGMQMHGFESYSYALLGDGECNEGSIWEAAMSAVALHLSRIIVVVDCNGLQSDGACIDVFPTTPLRQIWEGFGWYVTEAEGHDIASLCKAFDLCRESRRASVILAKTVKGKGVSFMENQKEWHHANLSDQQFRKACEELINA